MISFELKRKKNHKPSHLNKHLWYTSVHTKFITITQYLVYLFIVGSKKLTSAKKAFESLFVPIAHLLLQRIMEAAIKLNNKKWCLNKSWLKNNRTWLIYVKVKETPFILQSY